MSSGLLTYVSLSRLTIAFGNVSLERLTYKTESNFGTVPEFWLKVEFEGC